MLKSLNKHLKPKDHLYINKLVTRLVKESRDGSRPKGIDIEMFQAYQEIRDILIDDKFKNANGSTKLGFRSTRGSKGAWEFLVKWALFEALHKGQINHDKRMSQW